jgi:N6-adenosine-specific RNA methylase IME4
MSGEPSQRFACLLMDPPWMERGGGRIKRGADRHYPLVKTADLPGVIWGSGVFRPAEHAHLWMWATANHLADALWLIDALGFRYTTHACWFKTGAMGLGQYFRMQHELLLFATRGRGYAVRTDARNLPSVIVAPRGRHSEKPVEAYQLIEARSHGPRVELFARRARPGWTVWGNEAPPS